MAGNIKLTEIVRPFDGSNDFFEWVQRLELIGQLQGVENMAKFVPLFISGGAFSVYNGLSAEEKNDYGLLKKALMKAFSIDQFVAFERLKERKLVQNESVDVYLADIKRLVTLSCKSTPLEDCKELIKTAFVSGLNRTVKCQIKSACALNSLTLEAVVERTRSVLSVTENGDNAVFVAKAEQVRKCYLCNSSQHLKGDCPRNQFSKESRRCYLCNSDSHLLPQCPRKVQSKNEQGS